MNNLGLVSHFDAWKNYDGSWTTIPRFEPTKLSEEEYEQYLLWLDAENDKAMAAAGITPWFFPPDDYMGC